MSRRKRRVTTITPDNIRYEDDTIAITEYRDGVEHVVRVKLDAGEYYMAHEMALASRKHVATVVQNRERRLRWASEALAEIGGAK